VSASTDGEGSERQQTEYRNRWNSADTLVITVVGSGRTLGIGSRLRDAIRTMPCDVLVSATSCDGRTGVHTVVTMSNTLGLGRAFISVFMTMVVRSVRWLGNTFGAMPYRCGQFSSSFQRKHGEHEQWSPWGIQSSSEPVAVGEVSQSVTVTTEETIS
jgi:hypothetical protein